MDSRDSPLSDRATELRPSRLNFWRTHQGEESVAETIKQRFQPNSSPGSVTALSKRVKLPEATVRGIGSFYSDLACREGDEMVRVCDGTSCRLEGTKETIQQLKRFGHLCQKVYCLGHCDRSPVAMDGFELSGEGEASQISCVAPQTIVTARTAAGGVPGLKEALEVGVYESLTEAFSHDPIELVETIEAAGERGRGGAGYPTGEKWRTAAATVADKRYVIANGDEGDPGSFVDRVLMEYDPHSILEGMILCGYAIGANEGIVYIRSEYPHAILVMKQAILEAQVEGFLGQNICGSGFDFDVRVVEGMGSYVCGEETALIHSIEGLRGEVQIRPPYPANYGLYGRPTVVNNVETLLNIPFIVKEGAAAYRALGTSATSGTKAICLNRGFARPGIVEVEFGTTFREIIENIAGGGRDGVPLVGVLVGGPMGTLLMPEDWDLPICFDVLSRHDIQLGHGGMVAIPETADFRDLLEHLIEFMVRESCGKCAPCRLGSQALLNAFRKSQTREELELIIEAIELGSLCAFGQFVPGPIRTLLSRFTDRIFIVNEDADTQK